MKKRFLLLFSLLLLSLSAYTQPPSPESAPKMVVGIVVDQMRWDYLYRFQDRYEAGGFRRLMEQGFNCQKTYINYLPSYTAPGHTCIYTGSVPALHGIVANDWIDNRTGRSWYCTEDTTVQSVGGGKAGLMSPRNMLASTITDELRLATNFRSRTYGISIKDRGAILPAGHSANAAYWYDGGNGHFISSSFYMQQLPAWLQQFNERNVGDSLMSLNWNTLYPIATYVQSTADDNPYEGAVKGEEKPVFPHLTVNAVNRKDKGAIRVTPHGNTIVRMMAEACIEGEQLGSRGFTDFLAVSFSSSDYIGHQYGPNAIEVEDSYLRLDKDIALLLSFLNRKLGAGNYTVFLTADHGGAHNTVFLNDHRLPAGGLKFTPFQQQLNSYLASQLGHDSLVSIMTNYQVYFNEERIRKRGLNRDEVKQRTSSWLRQQDGVTTVFDMEEPNHNHPSDLYTMAVNGYFRNRCGALQMVLHPGWYDAYATTGTTHGGWNPYDTHIPLLWYGWGIRQGESFKKRHMTDIAATLAALLHIQEPNACVGEVIEEALQ